MDTIMKIAWSDSVRPIFVLPFNLKLSPKKHENPDIEQLHLSNGSQSIY